MNNRPILLIIIVFAVFFSCNNRPEQTEQTRETFDVNENRGNEELLAINASQYGAKYPETFVLMQNRRGIRIEYCIDRGNLQLWISPQLGKSFSYEDINWSNRDDHTRVYDRILFPNLSLNDFDSCDYDPFYSVLHFKNQKLHILNLYDEPAIAVWFEKEDVIDVKSFKSDDVIKQDPRSFVIDHHDRGREFEYAAVLGSGSGSFQHQRDFDEGRSIYARANMAPGQLLYIGAELKSEQVEEFTRALAGRDIEELIQENSNKVDQQSKYGHFRLKNRPEMQKLLDINREIALSMQDKSGFLRSTNKYIYYLLWYRDGGMNASHLAYSGWVDPAGKQANVAILNPNYEYENPENKFYGQIMAGPITKREEDGLFFVVWPAFSHWTMTGDNTYVSGKYLDNMEEGMRWLEEECYDPEMGLFGRYHYCETPLTGSRGDGWDDAVGKPTFKWDSEYQGQTIVRSYDIYINLLNYSVYLMLASMTEGEKHEQYMENAAILEKNMMKFYETGSELLSYGTLLAQDGSVIEAEPWGLDRTDYLWSLAIPVFRPNLPEQYDDLQNAMFRELRNDPQGHFLCAYNAFLTSLDTETFPEDSIMAALDYLVPQSLRPGTYLPMPYTIPEIVDVEDGHPFHDVRPLVYSIAPWLSAVTNLGIRKLPFGVALRATGQLENIRNFQYMEELIDIDYTGSGKISRILINGEEVKNSFQVPDNKVREGSNKILVELSEKPEVSDLLISSTVRLNSLFEDEHMLVYKITAYSQNRLVFKNLQNNILIMDKKGNEVSFQTKEHNGLKYIEFEGRGEYEVLLDT